MNEDVLTHEDPSLNSQNQRESQARGYMPVITAYLRQRPEALWSSSASQPSQTDGESD